jgi:hypothetical protein
VFYAWKLDSTFIFNSDSTLFFTTINLADNRNRNAIADDLSNFAGRKINNKWYFFFGSSTVLLREYYQYSKYNPLSFEEMSYLAYEQNFSYSIENNKPLPEEAMDDFFGGGMVQYLGIKGRKNINTYIDSMALVTNAAYHAKKMSKEEIAEIQKTIDESVRPSEQKKETKQWWQFWKEDPQIPIFETEEWKDYLKKKYGSKWQEHL